MRQPYSLWIGFDPRETAAYAVARSSALTHASSYLPIEGIVLDDLRNQGLYTRPTTKLNGIDRNVLWDEISEAPMSTEFAIARFLVPHLAEAGWAMFTDCDVLFRANPIRLMEKLDPRYAVYCVKHNHRSKMQTKMDNQPQTDYPRKNWSSVMVFNCSHPSNKKLAVEMVNALPGRDLHRFCWLQDEEIGELDREWNYLVGEQEPPADPKIVHFTMGGPWFPHYENVPYADEWRECLHRWAR